VRRIVAITLGLAYLIAEFFNVPEVGLRWAVWLSCDLSGAFTFLYLYVHPRTVMDRTYGGRLSDDRISCFDLSSDRTAS